MKKIYILLTLVLLALPLSLSAKDWNDTTPSASEIDSRLYKLMEKMDIETNLHQKYLMAKQLNRLCLSNPDARNVDYVRAEALCVLCNASVAKSDPIDSIKNRMRECQRLAEEKTHILSQFFTPWEGLINFYRSKNMANIAMNECQRMLQKSVELNYMEGTGKGYMLLGMALHEQRSEANSTRYLERAADIFSDLQTTQPNKDFSNELFQCYDKISSNYLQLKDYKKAEEFSHKSQSYAKSETNKFLFNIRYAAVLAILNKGDKTWKFIEDARKVLKKYPHYTGRFYLGLAYYYYDLKEYEKALCYCDSCEAYGSSALHCRPQVYEAMGDYKRANEANKLIIENNDSLTYSNSSGTIDEINTMLNQDRFDLELKREREKHYESSINILLIISISLIIALAFSLYTITNLRRTSKEQKAICAQHEHKINKLQRKNGELSHSIDEKTITEEGLRGFIEKIYQILHEPLHKLNRDSERLTKAVSENRVDDAEDALNYVRTNINDILRLTSSLADLNEFEKNRYSDTPMLPTSTEAICGHIESIVIPHQERKRYTNQFKVIRDADLLFYGDEKNILRIIRVLLINANKFTKGGNITFECKIINEQRNIQFTVTDTGEGIKPENVDKVFEVFFKENELSEGYGIGLYYAKLLTNKMSGTIEINKDYKEGCQIILTIPTNLDKKNIEQ